MAAPFWLPTATSSQNWWELRSSEGYTETLIQITLRFSITNFFKALLVSLQPKHYENLLASCTVLRMVENNKEWRKISTEVIRLAINQASLYYWDQGGTFEGQQWVQSNKRTKSIPPPSQAIATQSSSSLLRVFSLGSWLRFYLYEQCYNLGIYLWNSNNLLQIHQSLTLISDNGSSPLNQPTQWT